MSGEENKPVIVPEDFPADEANAQYGEDYGVDWVYESDADEVLKDTSNGADTEDSESESDTANSDNDEASGAGSEESISSGTDQAPPDESASQDQEEPTDSDEEEEDEAVEVVEDPTADLSSRVKGLYLRLESYVRLMGPHTRPSIEMAKQQQRELYNILQDILALDDAHFDEGMDMTLRMFRAHNGGAFSKRLVFRFLEYVAISPEDLKAFSALLRLFTQTANPATRKEMLATVDLPGVVKRLSDVRAQQRLLAFYSYED